MRRLGLVLWIATACASEGGRPDGGAEGLTAGSTSGAASTGAATSSTDGTTGSDETSPADSSGGGAKFDVPSDTDPTGGVETYPVRMIPGLVSITFYERTGGEAPMAYTFAVDSPELTTREVDPLTTELADIVGTDVEYYDVYYSDEQGDFELDGRYLTISGQFGAALPAGGGLNLAEIGLDYEGAPSEFGNYVASYQILGDNAVQPDGDVELAIDGDLQTHTTMGNTVGIEGRLRVTLGFASSSGPPG